MAPSDWTGGIELFDTPENRDTNRDTGAVPGAGAGAVIEGGIAPALAESIPAGVVLGGTDPSVAPVLGSVEASERRVIGLCG